MTVERGVRLADVCTLNVGGEARHFSRVTATEELRDVLAWAHDTNIPVHILGGGSNVVFADTGFDGLVIHVAIGGVSRGGGRDRVLYRAGAGEPWDPFVAATVADGCAGLECLSGIPGQVGGTPVQNVGAYGQDVSSVVIAVDVLDRHTLAIERLANADCDFGYRTSRFKRRDLHRFVVTHVEFELTRGGTPTMLYPDVVEYFAQRGDTPSLAAAREGILTIRRRKGMVIEDGNPANRSVGSFFVNPIISVDHLAQLERSEPRLPRYPIDDRLVKVPAAWLIERAGFPKGTPRGPVGVSPFQAQAIVNHGGGTAAGVVSLAVEIKRAVLKMFSIALVPEPVFAGFHSSPELSWLLNPDADRVKP